jgi:hypothetical protein
MKPIVCLISIIQFVWDGLYRCFYWLFCCGRCNVTDDEDSDEEEKDKRDN